MKSRTASAIVVMVITFSAISFCATTPSAQADVPHTQVYGPAPVPICPPEEGGCSTLPKASPVYGPAPVPICPPEEDGCSTLPKALPVYGPAPVPICPPEEDGCSTLPKGH